MKRVFPALLLLAGASVLAGCDKAAHSSNQAAVPLVKTVAPAAGAGVSLGMSGTVRARVESPLAFQVGGRIAARSVDAGRSVQAGQQLFELDQRDLLPMVRAAEADLAAAESALANAESELARQRQLLEKNFTSAQALDQVQLLRRQMQSQRDAAAARLVQARNAHGYARLQAPAGGVLIDVTGEVGQVVAAGQPVAMLAHAGEREVEVYFPEILPPPQHGEALLADGKTLSLRLRETAGAVDPLGRTRRARYTVQGSSDALVLGAVLRTRFSGLQAVQGEFAVPIGAIDERGKGPRIWRVANGRATALPVRVLALDSETARISGSLAPADRIVALGTHLLTDNMAVRELGR